jgi:hypothetical protein
MKKKWIILANWILSPAWYVLAQFLYMLAYGLYSGQCVCTGILDIILTIGVILFVLPSACIMYLTHYPIYLLLYYSVSGALLYVGYYAYKNHKRKMLGGTA